MALLKFEPIWKLISEYNFKVDVDSISDHLICILCKNLIADAYEMLCGCHYCHSCIDAYLANGDQYCPGGKIQCNKEYLVMETGVFRNLRINNDIYNLKVFCPNEMCQLNIDFNQMEEHLRVCKKQAIECPYLNIGCDNKETDKGTIVNHLNSDVLLHTQLLMVWIQNLKNEVDEFKAYVEKNKLEMSSLKDDSRIKEMQITELRREIEGLKEKSRDNENRIVMLEEQLREVKDEMDIRVNGEREDRMRLMEEQSGEIERVINECMAKKDNMIKAVDEMRECRERRMTNLIKIYPIIDADFVWRIDGYTQKRGTETDSESFYANNYKLCLRLYIHSDGSIGLYYRIMKGDNDDQVQWPMTRAVTLSLIDQATLMAHSAVTIKYDTANYDESDFDRPMNDGSDFIRPWYIWSHLSIKDTPSVFDGDSIVVSCVVTDP